VQLAASSQIAVNLFIQNTSEVSLGEIRLPASDEDRRQVIILQDLEILTIGTGKDNRINNLVKIFMYRRKISLISCICQLFAFSLIPSLVMVFQAFMYMEAVVILLLPISTNLPYHS
jgi:hypothetical protein